MNFSPRMIPFFLYFALVFPVCAASEFKFGIQRSSMWQFIGRKVSFSLTMDIPESTPLQAKIKLPPNGTAKLRLTQVKFALVSEYLNASINTTTLISSASEGLKDIALIDLGDVTRIPTDSSTQIKIDFEVQLLSHVHIINGGVQWVSVGVQYINQSVWAAQLAVKTIKSAVSRPDLMISFWSDSGCVSDTFDKGEVIYRLILSHSDLTTEEVASGMIEWPLPPVLRLKTWNKVDASINVEVVNETDRVTIEFGQFNFSDTIDLEVTFNLDLHKTHADGKLHDLTTYVIVKYNGSLNTCSSFSGSREFTFDEPATTSITYYVPQLSCDLPLGMMDGRITNAQITASSHATGGEPYQGRLNSSSAWIPWNLLAKDKQQYLEVNFNTTVKIVRLVTKGLGKSYVKSISLCYSHDGAIFKRYMQGRMNKDLPANNNCDCAAGIILPTPFEAVFVRINPTSWQNSIALRIEFYGCRLGQPAIPGSLKFTSRGYYLDKTRDIMYICNVKCKEHSEHSPNCFFSKDMGASWTAMHWNIISILGHDTVENILYAVTTNGRTVLKSTQDHSSKFITVSVNDWDAVKVKGTTNLAVMIGSELIINDTNKTPPTEHTVTSTSGTKWGVSPLGVYVEELLKWKLKASWSCHGCFPCHFDFESGGLDGWTKSGTAFNNQPTYGDNPTARGRGQPANQQGDWWIATFENRPSPTSPAGSFQDDGPQGTLASPPFIIVASGKMSFLIGGGCDINLVRVELVINNQVVRKATGKCTETMARQTWDASEFVGQKAFLRLVDAHSYGWGHINFDDLRGDIDFVYCHIY